MNKDNQKGNVVIEASIVMTLTIVMLGVLINLGFLLYQRTLMDVTANQVAVDVGNVYAVSYRDPIYGYVEGKELYKTELYRYLGNIFTNSLEENADKKAKWYGLYRLKKGQIVSFEDPEISLDIVRKPGTLIQHQAVVYITADIELPLTSFWGGENSTTYTAVGRADCIDLLDYFNTTGTVKDCILSKLDKLTEHLTKLIGIFDFSSMKG